MPMGTTITFRTDDVTDEALAALMADGSERSDVIRAALLAQAKRLRQAELRAEAERLASDPEYQEVIRAVQQDMAAVRAW